ncbi:Strabismus [Echinococcus multilocularis]|uniref:Strabismus n=1 Tax=Echinococcus multilocularis TaxID=6211 RepID=A0A068YDG4_ECHMU|nr:Strabismus [Echinococcus multilocularis]
MWHSSDVNPSFKVRVKLGRCFLRHTLNSHLKYPMLRFRPVHSILEKDRCNILLLPFLQTLTPRSRSNVTVIHRVPGKAITSYWRQDPSGAFLLHHEARGGRFENESSSTTLSCADSYQAQQSARENGGSICENGMKATTTDVDEGTTVCAVSQRSLTIGSSEKNYHCRRRRSSDGGGEQYLLDRHRKRSHKNSAHCLSEGEVAGAVGGGRRHGRHRWSRRRSEEHQCSASTHSPSCNCDYSYWSSWTHGFDHDHTNSLPTMKKHWYRESNSSPKLRRRKPITGMFGANLLASQEEEQWSDSEQIRMRLINPNYCGLVGLSCICLLAVGCLLSPIFMLLIPLVPSLGGIDTQNFAFPPRLHIIHSCNVRCEADLLSIAVKILLLCLTTWKLYVQPIVCVCRRLRICPLSASALLNRKFRAIGYINLDFSPFDPATLHPFPSTERLIGLTLSVNFLGVGATCAFWVAFAARWMKWLLRPRAEHFSAVSQDLHAQFGLPAAVAPPAETSGHIDPANPSYASLVSFVLTFTDTLLLLHLVGVVLRTWNCIKGGGRHYVVQVVRSPDGASKTYRLTGASLEVVAMQIIQKYNVDFPLYDAQVASAPYRYIRISPDSPTNRSSKAYSRRASLRLRQKLASFSCLTQEEQEYQMKRCSSAGGGSSFKFYSLDGPEACSTAVESLTTLKGGGCIDSGESGRNVSALCADRYHSEAEFERVVRKRRMRLLIVTEKAFTGVEAVSPDEIRVPGCNGTMPPRQAAQVLFPKIIVPLQKYLRLTRLQHLHPPDTILSRLSVCLAHSASAEAFLSIFRSEEPNSSVFAAFLAPRRPTDLGAAPEAVVGCYRPSSLAHVQLAQSWRLHLIDAEGASRPPAMFLKPGTRFHLSRAGVTLFCHIHLEPLLSLKRVKQTLRMVEETFTL